MPTQRERERERGGGGRGERVKGRRGGRTDRRNERRGREDNALTLGSGASSQHWLILSSDRNRVPIKMHEASPGIIASGFLSISYFYSYLSFSFIHSLIRSFILSFSISFVLSSA